MATKAREYLNRVIKEHPGTPWASSAARELEGPIGWKKLERAAPTVRFTAISGGNPRVTIRIGNGAGFLGDNLDAPRRLVERSQLDYLTLEYLAELTLSILAVSEEKDPQAGYAADFIEVLGSLTAGPDGPAATEDRYQRGRHEPALLCGGGCPPIMFRPDCRTSPIAVVTGDDLLARVGQLQATGCPLSHLDTGQPLAELGRAGRQRQCLSGLDPLSRAWPAGPGSSSPAAWPMPRSP